MFKSLLASATTAARARLRKTRLLLEVEDHRRLRREVDQLRSIIDLGKEAPAEFERERHSPAYQAVFDKSEPLVTACIATYNRGELLAERSLKSLLAQDYRNLQIIVVGDCCTDDTAARMAKIRDSRLTFINLPERGRYPEAPEARHLVAGTVPVNRALELAEGDFITHLDDDDEHTPDRVSALLELVRGQKLDLAWHPFWAEQPNGKWLLNEALEFRNGQLSTSSILYHRWFRRIPWDIQAWMYSEPGDWNRLRKFYFLGAKAARHPGVLLRHYRERNQKKK